MGSGCAVLDFDQDGWMDVLLVNGGILPGYRGEAPRTQLYRNLGDGRFADVTARSGITVTTYGMGAAVGDYDNDGFPDIYITGVHRSQLFHNNGDGTFRDATVSAGVANDGQWGTACAWFDYDRDGFLDLFVGNFLDYSIEKEQAVRARVPDLKTYFPGFYERSPLRLYRNRGNGTFADATAQAGLGDLRMKALGVAVFDYDDDGWPDLFIANDGYPNELLRNRQDGTFEPLGRQAAVAYDLAGGTRSGMGTDTGDFRNRGADAITVTNFAQERIGFYDRVNATGYRDIAREVGLAAPTNPYVGWGVRFFDFDLDGWLDLAVANGHVLKQVVPYLPGDTFTMPGLLFRSERGERYTEVTADAAPALATPQVWRGLAVTDFDNDGDPDLLLTINGGPDNTGGVRLLRNDQHSGQHWLGVRALVGRRDALGARVRATAGGLTQERWVRSGSSYLSESDPRALFGLGGASRVERLEIRWPDGHTTELRDQAADAYLVVDQQRGLVARVAAGQAWHAP